MTKEKGSEFLRFCIPIVETLRDLGGSGRPAEVTDRVIERMNISEEEQEVPNKNGGSRIRNQIAWARFYLVKAKLLTSSQRGVWGLTGKDRDIKMDKDYVLKMFRDVQLIVAAERKVGREAELTRTVDDIDVNTVESDSNYKSQLLATLQSLPPLGFEHICKRLLDESGIQEVTVTGKSGDGGIDGEGILQINAFVSFKVVFQCKRYKGTVTASSVRDFRGSMQGHAEKGIILTTGAFTTDAKKEAKREGAIQIELVDGDKLIGMFAKFKLGLNPKEDYELDEAFFDEFRDEFRI